MGAFHGLRYKGNLGALLVPDPHHKGAEWPQTMVSRPAIFTDGTLAPPVTYFTTCKSFSRSVNATKAHNIILEGGASFNGGIFFAVAAVDRALKGSMAAKRINKSFGREVREEIS
jgi:hypothetical protein